MSEWLDFDDVLAVLGVSESTLRRFMRSGRIKYYKLNDTKKGRVRFNRKDILDFLKECRR